MEQTNHHKRWTEAEEAIVAECMEENLNKQIAFHLAAEKLGRSEGAVMVHWYRCMKENPKYSALFLIITRKKVINNGNFPTSNNIERSFGLSVKRIVERLIHSIFGI